MNQNNDTLNREERNLLLYLETRAVDYGGLVDGRQINSDDITIAKDWDKKSFISFGRILYYLIQGNNTYYVKLSDQAWEKAHQLRQERGKRNINELVNSCGGRE